MEALLLKFILSATWLVLNTTSSINKDTIYDQVYSSQDVFEEIASSVSLTFSTCLWEMFQAITPPTIDTLKTLRAPVKTDRLWAIYLVVLEKPGCKPKIYIGSGTGGKTGVWRRVQAYYGEYTLPRYVATALNHGFKVTHVGLLCWIDIPPPARVPILRTFFLLLEATFTYILWAMRSVEKDAKMSFCCLWDHTTLEYDGCCGHCCLSEPIIGDRALSAEQLEALSIERKKNHNKLNKDSRTRIRKAKVYYCDICKISKVSQYRLDQHNITPAHIRKAADMTSTEKPYKCFLCNAAFKIVGHLNRHNKSVRH